MKKAFTLIELIVVVTVLVIIIVLLIPAFREAKQVSLGGKSIELWRQVPVAEIVNGQVYVEYGKQYRIPLKPSLVLLSGEAQIMLGGMPDGVSTLLMDGTHYLVWEPKQVTRIEVKVITIAGEVKDEKILVLQAR